MSDSEFTNVLGVAVDASALNRNSKPFSVCTLVTDRRLYESMLESFRAGGFHEPECEFLFIDNSNGNQFDAFAAYNIFLNEARGEFIILCHQDVALLSDGRDMLSRRLDELSQLDPRWGVCGNAGGVSLGRLAIRITDPHGQNQSRGTFPARATALDENFIVVRRSANLALSTDFRGFHLYGAELCIVADILGYSSYVIDFHLRHYSRGNADASFYRLRKEMVKKYQYAFRSRWVVTPFTDLFLSSSGLLSRLFLSPFARIPRSFARFVAARRRS